MESEKDKSTVFNNSFNSNTVNNTPQANDPYVQYNQPVNSNAQNNFNIYQFLTLISNLNLNPYAKNLRLKQDDERVKILNTLKDFLPEDKRQIIDEIIKAFSAAKNP